MKKTYYKNLKVTEAPDSEVIIQGEIPFEIVEVEYRKIYETTKNQMEISGFRPGKAPEHLIKANINELALLDKASEEVLKNEYAAIVENLKLFPIDRPQIEILKLAHDNPLGIKITVAVMPKIELPDYKKIAKAENKDTKDKVEKKIEVTDKEVDTAVEEVRKMYAHQEHHKQNPNKEHTEGESYDHLMPEITDEFVKKIGEFKDVAEFRSKLKENIGKEKETKQKEKHRIAIIEAIINDFEIDLPKVLVESELDKMVADLNNRITSAGIIPTDYYKQLDKTEADMRSEWKNDAVKKVKSEIILADIAKQEKIKVKEEDIEKETKYLVSYYKGTDPERARIYVEHMLSNDLVLEFLESL